MDYANVLYRSFHSIQKVSVCSVWCLVVKFVMLVPILLKHVLCVLILMHPSLTVFVAVQMMK